MQPAQRCAASAQWGIAAEFASTPREPYPAGAHWRQEAACAPFESHAQLQRQAEPQICQNVLLGAQRQVERPHSKGSRAGLLMHGHAANHQDKIISQALDAHKALAHCAVHGPKGRVLLLLSQQKAPRCPSPACGAVCALMPREHAAHFAVIHVQSVQVFVENTS